MPLSTSVNLQDKHWKSNQARLQSLELLKTESKKSRLVIKAALDNLDTSKKRHIKFADSDDDVGSGNDVGSVGSHITKFNDVLGFDNDEEITIDPIVGKKSAQKIKQIQSNVGVDERFQIDERFVESDGDVSDDVQETEDTSDEVKKNLAVLQQVVGISNLSKLGKHKQLFQDPSSKRYDPSQLDHMNMEIEITKRKVNEPKKKKQKKEKTVPKVNKKKYFEVSSSELQQAFGKKGENKKLDSDGEESDKEQFSILTMLGRNTEDFIEETNKVSEYKTMACENEDKGISKLLSSHFSKFDDNDSDASDYEKLDTKEIVNDSVTKKEIKTLSRSCFLFSEKDERIANGPRRFCTDKPYELIRIEWEQVKDDLQDFYKDKHKAALRLKKKEY